jgi:trehalose-6-phosphate synthase
VLVLSSGAGAFAELGRWAIPIEDPTDVEETSRAIERAIDLDPGEAEERAVALRNAAAATTPEDWIRAQIADLKAIRDAGAPRTDPPV